jgi:hypothetical protein
MRIDELTGVKKYKERTLWDVLDDFTKAGGSWANGSYGTVLLHSNWNYVYKFFTDDVPYLRFIRWAARNPHPCLPRVLSPVRRWTPFYKRHKKDDQVYIVKLEKLNEWDVPLAIRKFGGVQHFIEHVGNWVDDYLGKEPPRRLYFDFDQEGNPTNTVSNNTAFERWERIHFILRDHPEVIPLLKFFPTLMRAVEASPDVNERNIMQRDDGSLVYTDPFWEGESVYQMAARAQQAEIDYNDDEPDPRDLVSGSQRWKPPKKIKQKPALGWSNGEDDLPF